MASSYLLVVLLAAVASATPQFYPSTYSVGTSSSYGTGRPWWSKFFRTSYSGSGGYPLGEREIYPEWFEVEEAEDCENVPESVNTGRPRDLCGEGDLGTRFCVCLKRPNHRNPYAGASNGYEAICGECRDPCALRFIPDTFPRRRDDSDEDDDDRVGNRRGNNNN